MMFSKTKLDLKKIKEEDPEAYQELVSEAENNLDKKESVALKEARERIAAFEVKEKRKEIDAKIEKYGVDLNVPEIAKEAIENGLEFSDALVKIIDAHIENQTNLEDSFDETAPAQAGVNNETEDEEAPKSMVEAIRMIAERDGITKAEAAKKAMKEFPNLIVRKVKDLEEED